MFREILTEAQTELLPLVREFAGEYHLAGGTAIGLYIGHRHSIDFDLFTSMEVRRLAIKSKIEKYDFPPISIIYEAYDQLHLLVNSVKLTFFNSPFSISPNLWFDNIIQMPSLLDLAAMRVFSLGGRAKWKDYVDLYFLFKNHFSISQVCNRAGQIFGT